MFQVKKENEILEKPFCPFLAGVMLGKDNFNRAFTNILPVECVKSVNCLFYNEDLKKCKLLILCEVLSLPTENKNVE